MKLGSKHSWLLLTLSVASCAKGGGNAATTGSNDASQSIDAEQQGADDASVDATGDSNVDASPAPYVPPPNAKIVFITKDTFDGNLGGVAGAHAKCAAAAASARLPGTYKAWITDSNTATSPTKAWAGGLSTMAYALPWPVNGNYITVASSGAALSGTLMNPISQTEFGMPPAATPTKDDTSINDTCGNIMVWTNTNAGGAQESADNHCGNWTSANPPSGGAEIGNAAASQSGEWAVGCAITGVVCKYRLHLYCFQQ